MNYDKVIQGAFDYKNYDELSVYFNAIYKEVYTADFLNGLSNSVWASINEMELQEAILHFVEWNHFTGEWNICKPRKITSAASIFASVLFWVDERLKQFGCI